MDYFLNAVNRKNPYFNPEALFFGLIMKLLHIIHRPLKPLTGEHVNVQVNTSDTYYLPKNC